MELLVAILILVIGILAVLSMESVAMNSNTHAHRLTVATTLAQQVLEDVMAWDKRDPRIDPSAGNGQFTYNLDPAKAGTTDQSIAITGAGTFTCVCNRTFGTSVNGIPDGVVRLDVTIRYSSTNIVSLSAFKRYV